MARHERGKPVSGEKTDMKKIMSVMLACLVSVLLLDACGKEKKTLFLKPNADMQGGYDLQELDLAELGIGNPGGICIYDDSIYICDLSNNCIVKLGMDLAREDSFGTLGMEEGNFSEPRDITFADGCFYVLDEGNNRVQKFTSDFEYLEMYYLHPPYAQMTGKYVSIAVDAEGIVYVSMISPDPMDAYIFAYKEDTWEKIGDKVVGYLCAGEESMYFVNTLEMNIAEKVTEVRSGENMLYELDKKGISLIARIDNKYAPTALACWNGSIYMVSAATGEVNCFSYESDNFATLFAVPEGAHSLDMHMSIDTAGNIYISDCENGCLYFAEKQ